MTTVATVGSRQASRFNPANLGGLALWLDAADSNTLTLSGSNVTQWRDKSGNARNAAPFASASFNSPTFSNNAIRFNSGSNQGLVTSLSAALTVESVFIVCGFTTLGNVNTLLGCGKLPDSGNGRQFRVTNTMETIAQDTAIIIYGPGTSLSSNTTYILSYVNTGTTLTHFLNTLSDATANTYAYSTGATVTSIGTRSGTDAGAYESMNGYVHEIIVFSNAVQGFQKQQIEGYLAWKWGLTSNLPSTHFSRTLPPFSRTAWSPLDAGDCVLWLDSTDMSGTPTNGATVSNWFDKSGLSNHYTGGGASITYQTNILNSLPAIRFTAGGRLANSSPTDFPVGTTSAFESTSFVVASASNTNTGGIMVFGPVAGGRAKVYYTGGGSVFSTMFGGVAGISNAITTGTAFVFSDTYRFTGTTSNTSHTGWLNGSNVGSATGTTVNLSNTPNYIGHTGFGSEYFSGNIHEIIHYRGVLPETNRILVEAYLAQKWGLTSNLPTGHLARLSRPVAPYFTPAAVPACYLWLDGADSNAFTFSSGSNISQWNDKSGNGYNFVVSGTPSLSNNALNGRSVVSLSTGNFLSNATMPFPNTSFSLFVVAILTGSSGYGYERLLNGGTGDQYLYVGTTPGGNVSTFLGTGGGWNDLAANTPNASFSSWQLVGMNVSSNSLTPYRTGNVQSNKNGTMGAVNGLCVGGPYDYWPGMCAEVLIFSNALGAAQRQKIEGYLAWKWGLQASLPSSHPYSKYAPT